MFCSLKRKNVSCLFFKTQPKPWRTSYFFNDFKQRKTIALFFNKKALLRGITYSNNGDFFFAWIIIILSEQKPNLNRIKEYVKIKISVM